MTSEQAKGFLREAFIAFPGVAQWVKDNSPDKEATISGWCKQLEKIEIGEAIAVLNRLRNGTLPAPTGYLKEIFISQVLGVVYADRDKLARQRQIDKVREHSERGSIFSKVPVLGPFMSDVASVMAEYNSGLINCEQKDAEIRKLELEAHAKIDANYARRSA